MPSREPVQISNAPDIECCGTCEHLLNTGVEIQEVLDSALCRNILDDAASALRKPLHPRVLGVVRHNLEVLRIRREDEDAFPRVAAMKSCHPRLLAGLERQHGVVGQHSVRYGAQISSKPARHRRRSSSDINGSRSCRQYSSAYSGIDPVGALKVPD